MKKQLCLRLPTLLVGLVDDHFDVPRQHLGFPTKNSDDPTKNYGDP